MGRIGNVLVKRTGRELFEEDGDKFTTDFNHNKKVVSELRDIYSAKLRNLIAGLVTRFKRRQEKRNPTNIQS